MPTFKKGDTLVCVASGAGYAGELTEGKEYTALQDSSHFAGGEETVRVLSDTGCSFGYRVRRFVPRTLITPAPAPAPAPAAPELALRFDNGKPEMMYVDMFPDALAGVCRTLEYGTKRTRSPYPKFNWCKGAPYSQLYNCARRHMLAFWNGQDLDKDALADGFEISNLDFAIGNLMRLRQQIADGRTDLDDRGYRQKAPQQEQEQERK